METYVDKYLSLIGENIERLMKEKKISQSEIVERCKKANFKISQGTISNAKSGKGNVTIQNLLGIAYALDVSLNELISEHDEIEDFNLNANIFSKGKDVELFTTDPDSKFFAGYMGDYHILFFKTSSQEKILVKGELSFFKDNLKCKAVLKIFTGDKDKSTGESAEKIYEGDLIISQSMHAGYCYLINMKDGEICMLVFHQWYLTSNDIQTMMASAITTASGSNRLPTVHRMCISRKKIEDAGLQELIKGQLLMNTTEIYLSDEQIQTICSSEEIPDSFKELLQKEASKEKCVCISETNLYDRMLTEDEQIKCISYVRAHSRAPKYNKISRRTDEALFSLYRNHIKGFDVDNN